MVNNCIGLDRGLDSQTLNGHSDFDTANHAFHKSKRVKSYCWSSPLENHEHRGILNLAERSYFMAVSDDNELVSFLHLHPPHDLINQRAPSWTCEVINHFDIGPTQQSKTNVVSCLPATYESPSAIVDQLSWSAWAKDSTGVWISTLAVSVNSHLKLKIVQAYWRSGEWRLTIDDYPLMNDQISRSTIRGRMAWTSVSRQSNSNLLFVLTTDALLRITCTYTTPYVVTAETVPFSVDSWDRTTGVSILTEGPSKLTVAVSSSSSDLENCMRTLNLDVDGQQSVIEAVWMKQLGRTMKEFSAKNALSNTVISRIHGIADSPRGEFSLASVTFHPNDGPEYTIVARQETFVLIGKRLRADGDFILSPTTNEHYAGDLAADSLMPSLMTKVREHDNDADQDDMLIAEDVIRSLALDNLTNIDRSLTVDDTTSLHSVIRSLRAQILHNEKNTQKRATTLVDIARGDADLPLAPDLGILKTLCSSTCSMPQALWQDHSLSTSVYQIHTTILRILKARELGRRDSDESLQDRTHEICDLCGSGIGFESLRWSLCQKGHQFSRCSLTFLSIQGPGKTKSCGICGSQYLNEYRIAVLQHEESLTGNGESSGQMGTEPLLRALFSACFVCIYCGGRFVA
ncbi:hypothetical protein ANO11243_045510 [Dothideomycetidae sp. 11243]|nr:hypothetical protein ANO11243_045510 [fungal sp. No.11243]